MKKKKQPLPQPSAAELAGIMLASPLPENPDDAVALGELGIRPTALARLLLVQLRRAAEGDLSAAKYLRETANSEIGRPAGTDTPCSLSGLSDSELYALIARTEAEP